jgi:hypothetical protein
MKRMIRKGRHNGVFALSADARKRLHNSGNGKRTLESFMQERDHDLLE